MGSSRLVLFTCLCLIVITLPVIGHKNPIIEYTRLGDWQTSFTFIPRQPMIGDNITIVISAIHKMDVIEEDTTAKVSIYQDDSKNEWRGGEPYYRPDWLLIKSEWAKPSDRYCFDVKDCLESSVTVGRPGNYVVTVDWYEGGQYKGQGMHHMDVEQRSMGPLYWFYGFLIVGAVLIGARLGIV